MKSLHILTFLLVVIGALNWGLVGLFDLNLVTVILGGLPGLEQLVYVLVGASGVYQVATHMGDCKVCSKK